MAKPPVSGKEGMTELKKITRHLQRQIRAFCSVLLAERAVYQVIGPVRRGCARSQRIDISPDWSENYLITLDCLRRYKSQRTCSIRRIALPKSVDRLVNIRHHRHAQPVPAQPRQQLQIK
jgi:hypothetical protein